MNTNKDVSLYFITPLILGITLSLTPFVAQAKLHLFGGLNRSLKDTQNQKGKAEDKPFSPTFALGYNTKLFNTGFGFSPQLGYIHTNQTANDSFGAQKVHSIFLNWDLIYITRFSPYLGLRFGIGNFIKRIKGEGGTVTIPNGSGTDEALRPSGTVTSYSSTFNFGFDYNFNFLFGTWFDNLGVRFETFVFRPLSSENRNYTFNLGVIYYF